MEFRLLRENEIDCRVSQIASNYCTLLLYKDARVDQNILDETVGCMNWQKRYVRQDSMSQGSWGTKIDIHRTSPLLKLSDVIQGLRYKKNLIRWHISRI